MDSPPITSGADPSSALDGRWQVAPKGHSRTGAQDFHVVSRADVSAWEQAVQLFVPIEDFPFGVNTLTTRGCGCATLVPWKRDDLPKSRSAAPGWQGEKSEHIGHM
jgi:hypothetical protein